MKSALNVSIMKMTKKFIEYMYININNNYQKYNSNSIKSAIPSDLIESTFRGVNKVRAISHSFFSSTMPVELTTAWIDGR